MSDDIDSMLSRIGINNVVISICLCLCDKMGLAVLCF